MGILPMMIHGRDARATSFDTDTNGCLLKYRFNVPLTTLVGP